jgi:hypothetical protein
MRVSAIVVMVVRLTAGCSKEHGCIDTGGSWDAETHKFVCFEYDDNGLCKFDQKPRSEDDAGND